MLSRFTIGSDPELFIFNTKTKKVVSAIDLIPGAKGTPYTEGLPEGFGLQTDNILAEFNIPPTSSKYEFISHIEYMKDYIRGFVRNINSDLDILCQASAKVPAKELKHPQAKEFGCMPDYSIYHEGPNVVSSAKRTTLRSCGCHIHVGYENPNIDTSIEMLRYIDAYVGIPSILYDTDTERRKLYGKAGCFRLTSYGFEYRTLSSYWITEVKTMEFIWNQLERALTAFTLGRSLPEKEIVQSIIDNNDTELAKKTIAAYGLLG